MLHTYVHVTTVTKNVCMVSKTYAIPITNKVIYLWNKLLKDDSCLVHA